MSAASSTRGARRSASRVHAGRASASFVSGYRGARYVATSVAEALPDYETGPSISVVPGAGRRTQAEEGLSAAALSVAKLCAVVCIALALIAVGRVAITSATAACALETRALQQDIESARDQGSDLEVAQSVLSKPSRIRAQAASLGMAEPTAEYSDQITLPDDVVSVDDAGRLSLSESVAAAAAAQ